MAIYPVEMKGARIIMKRTKIEILRAHLACKYRLRIGN